MSPGPPVQKWPTPGPGGFGHWPDRTAPSAGRGRPPGRAGPDTAAARPGGTEHPPAVPVRETLRPIRDANPPGRIPAPLPRPAALPAPPSAAGRIAAGGYPARPRRSPAAAGSDGLQRRAATGAAVRRPTSCAPQRRVVRFSMVTSFQWSILHKERASGGPLFPAAGKVGKRASRHRWFLDFLCLQEFHSIGDVRGIDAATDPLPLPL